MFSPVSTQCLPREKNRLRALVALPGLSRFSWLPAFSGHLLANQALGDLPRVQQVKAEASALLSRVPHPSTGDAEAVGAPGWTPASSTE